MIVPVYNTSKYLPACIESLVNQTLQEIEIILVNDASPDNSLEIMRSYQKKYPNKIVIIDSKENLRQGGARNLGIKAARGEFIGFTDSDDLVHKDMFRILVDKIRETDADYVCCQYARINEDITYSEAEKFTKPPLNWSSALKAISGKELSDRDRSRLIASEVGGFPMRLLKRECFLQNNLFFPEHLRYEDNYLGTMVEAHVKKICLIEQIMYYYRANPASTVNTKGIYQIIDRIRYRRKSCQRYEAQRAF